MRRAALLLALLPLLACASGGNDTAKLTEPEVQLVQLIGPSSVSAEGPFDAKYGMRIVNRSGEPITLKRIQLRSIGTGAYRLTRNDNLRFNETIQPSAAGEVEFWVHAYANVLPGEIESHEPVSLRGVAFFDSPAGAFRKVFHTTLEQDPSPSGR